MFLPPPRFFCPSLEKKSADAHGHLSFPLSHFQLIFRHCARICDKSITRIYQPYDTVDRDLSVHQALKSILSSHLSLHNLLLCKTHNNSSKSKTSNFYSNIPSNCNNSNKNSRSNNKNSNISRLECLQSAKWLSVFQPPRQIRSRVATRSCRT